MTKREKNWKSTSVLVTPLFVWKCPQWAIQAIMMWTFTANEDDCHPDDNDYDNGDDDDDFHDDDNDNDIKEEKPRVRRCS